MGNAVRYMRLQWATTPAAILTALATRSLLTAAAGAVLALAGIGDWRLVLAAAIAIPIGWYTLWLIANAEPITHDPLPPAVLLRTEHLEIRRLQRSDANAYEISLDPVMTQTNGLTPAHREAMITMAGSASALGRRSQLIAINSADSEPVAFASITNPVPPGIWSVGFWVTPASRGKGLAVEAMTGALEIIHDTGITVAHIGTGADNLAMQAVIRGAGGVFNETRPHELPNGTTTQSHWYTHRSIQD